MEAPPFENLRRFFERIKNVGFFERLFSWRTIVSSGYDAYGEYQQTQNLLQQQGQEITELTAKYRELSLNFEHRGQQLVQLQQDLVALAAKNEDLNQKMNERENIAGGLIEADKKNRDAIAQLKADLAAWAAKYDQQNRQYTEAQKTNIEYQQNEKARLHEHDLRVAGLNSLREQLEGEHLRINQERELEIHQKYKEIEETWKKHQELVEQSIKNTCQRISITYCSKNDYPYPKKPDNSIVICNQYVIFDAKSPENPEKLDNFPKYIEDEAKKIKKYIDGENVRKEAFLVVPTNSVQSLNQFVFPVGDGIKVYVVTLDSIEPILLALKKIEEYDFMEQMSPEDRDNICQVIGKFAYATKRRIQIDTFFSEQFLKILDNCSSLPEDIYKKLDVIEQSEIMNPPTNQRKKVIPINQLKERVKVIRKDAETRDIDIAGITQATLDSIQTPKENE